MSAELIVVNGPLAGTHLPLDQGEILIGRAPGSKLVLSDAEIGWRHCQVRRQGARYMVTDLRSSLGTYVNGMRSAERWLEDRDQLGIGKTILLFRSGEAETEARRPRRRTTRSPRCWPPARWCSCRARSPRAWTMSKTLSCKTRFCVWLET